MLQRSTSRVLGLLCVMYFITYVDRVNVTGSMGLMIVGAVCAFAMRLEQKF